MYYYQLIVSINYVQNIVEIIYIIDFDYGVVFIDLNICLPGVFI